MREKGRRGATLTLSVIVLETDTLILKGPYLDLST